MNTVGKTGRLGEQVRCVVSVAMLTEGWDANTVTHILGIRAFGSQLLCEQVVGRGLRRRSYAVNDDGPLRARVRRGLRRAVRLHPHRPPHYRPEAAGRRSRSWPTRRGDGIRFPKVEGYRVEVPDEPLTPTSPWSRDCTSARRRPPCGLNLVVHAPLRGFIPAAPRRRSAHGPRAPNPRSAAAANVNRRNRARRAWHSHAPRRSTHTPTPVRPHCPLRRCRRAPPRPDQGRRIFFLRQ